MAKHDFPVKIMKENEFSSFSKTLIKGERQILISEDLQKLVMTDGKGSFEDIGKSKDETSNIKGLQVEIPVLLANQPHVIEIDTNATDGVVVQIYRKETEEKLDIQAYILKADILSKERFIYDTRSVAFKEGRAERREKTPLDYKLENGIYITEELDINKWNKIEMFL